MELFDIQGRLVRTIVNESFVPAGAHEATIDGRGQRGEKLASGVYFVRGTTADGVFKNTILMPSSLDQASAVAGLRKNFVRKG